MNDLFDKLTNMADALIDSNWLACLIATGLVAVWSFYMGFWGVQ